jgi:hypothetical protein
LERHPQQRQPQPQCCLQAAQGWAAGSPEQLLLLPLLLWVLQLLMRPQPHQQRVRPPAEQAATWHPLQKAQHILQVVRSHCCCQVLRLACLPGQKARRLVLQSCRIEVGWAAAAAALEQQQQQHNLHAWMHQQGTGTALAAAAAAVLLLLLLILRLRTSEQAAGSAALLLQTCHSQC